MSLITALYNQLSSALPTPTGSCAGRTIIVIGSNTGLGKEAARHLVALGAATVILAVLSLDRGNIARDDIEGSTGKEGVVQVWELDMARYASVLDFGARVDKELGRLDVALLNAAVVKAKFEMAEQDETSVTVNVVSTFLFAFLLLHKMQETARTCQVPPTLSTVSSGAHAFTVYKERKAPPGGLSEYMNKDSYWS